MEHGIVYIGKVGLEELVTHREAEFEIINGYYYNDGRHNTIDHGIEYLYNLRPKLKQDNNSAQMVVKLLMNSMYGNTSIKPVETYNIVKYNRYDFEKSMPYNHNYIDSVIEVTGKSYITKVKSVLSYYNYVHCGVEILSMAKRSMNTVFSCAGECDVEICYQGTDSIHLNYDDVDTVVKIYKQKYGLELVGEDLGNVHTDCSMDKANSGIYALERVFLGKTTYIDSLESTDKAGKTINSAHIRTKGIPTSCIKYCAD